MYVRSYDEQGRSLADDENRRIIRRIDDYTEKFSRLLLPMQLRTREIDYLSRSFVCQQGSGSGRQQITCFNISRNLELYWALFSHHLLLRAVTELRLDIVRSA